MNNLVFVTPDNEVRTSTEIIAEGSEVQHKNVMELVRDNSSDLEEFGRVTFETRPFATQGGMQKREVALLNQEQTTLILTYMRNSEVVKSFKKALVKAFFEMARNQNKPMLPQTYIQALEAHLQSEKEKELLKLEFTEYKEEAQPKVETFDAIADSSKLVAVDSVAKMLNVPPKSFRLYLSAAGILRLDVASAGSPTAYWMDQEYMEFKYNKKDGEVLSTTPYFTPRGVIAVQRRFTRFKEKNPEIYSRIFGDLK